MAAYVATSPFRFGLELEMWGIRITFKRKNQDVFWSPPAAGVDLETTMMGLTPILVPQDTSTYFAGANTNWESDWGFRAVGDSFGHDTIKNQPAIYCILELATAANRLDDHVYWTSSRLCAKKFIETMADYAPNNLAGDGYPIVQDGGRRWYPINKFLYDYNNKIENLPNRPGFDKGKFKLKKSTGLIELENGNYSGVPADQFWDCFITCSNDTLNQWCDVQVNYQMSLRKLDTHLDAWIGIWNSIWLQKIGTGQIPAPDPATGETLPVRGVAPELLYKTQTYGALWRLARSLAHQHFTPPAPVDAVTDPLVFALITYVLAAGSVTLPQAADIGTSTVKNAFPQLPKTSPASVTQAVINVRPGITAFLLQVAASGALGAANRTQARADAVNSLRTLAVLAAPIGGAPNPANLPATSVSPGVLPAFNTAEGVRYTIGGAISPDFDNTWAGSLKPTLIPGPLNAYGFQVGAPFYCVWAKEVNTSYRAAVITVGGQSDIKVLLESRFGKSKLNLGFNPYVRDCLFNRSYLSLVRLLCTAAEIAAVTAAINTTFPDDPNLVQNFANGVH